MNALIRTTAFTLLLCCLICCASAEHTVEYYYRNYCESCTPEEEFAEVFEGLTGTNLADCSFRAYNVVKSEGQEALKKRAGELGIENPSLPMAIVDGTVYQGDTDMQSRLPKDALSWGGTTDSVLVYFYTPACESCGRARAVLDSLPSSVSVKRGMETVQSDVIIQAVDASRQPDLADGFFSAYEVPDDERVTPIVFLGDRYLSGAEKIERDLVSMVNLGWAAGGTKAVEKLKKTDGTGTVLSVTASIGAGLVAGLNPCAASMLLMFLALALQSGKHAGAMTLVFLVSKLLCYLLIGTLLLEALQAFNPTWMLPVARWVMTVLGVLLIALNLWDAWQIRTGHWDKIRNQLPGGMRKGLGGIVRRVMEKKRLWIAGVFLLGFLVAGGEFLCAGQLYLIRLLAAVRESRPQQIAGLIAYCLAFIAPAAVASALMLKGMASEKVSGFVARHMQAARTAAAVMTLAMIVLSWLT